MLDRNPERVGTLNRDGIRYERDATARRVTVRATVDPDCVSDADVVLVCVKAFDTESLLERIAARIRSDTRVISLQNGLTAADLVARYAGAARTVVAVTGQGATRRGPGHVRHAGEGDTRVAPYRPEFSSAARDTVALLQSCGMAAYYDPDRERVMWSKVIINAGINPVTALADAPNGALLERPDLFERARRAALEAGRVAAAQGITPSYGNIGDELRRVCSLTAANLSSMVQDMRRGQRTEIDAINGAIVNEGLRLGIPVPVNTALTLAVRKREV